MASLLPNVKQRFFDLDGLPLAGGKLYSYQAGTSTPLATFIDQSEATPNTNPIILDANGEANVWIGDLAYKFVLTDANDVPQWTVDQVIRIENNSIVTAYLQDGSVTTVKIADANITTAKIQDGAVTTAKIPDGAIVPTKIPDGSLGLKKLSADNALGFYDAGPGQHNGGVRVQPIVPWSAPTLIANPTALPGAQSTGVAWSPDGRFLGFSENATTFASFFLRDRNTIKKVALIDLPYAAAGSGIAWSPDSQLVVVGKATAPYFALYHRINDGWRLAYPPALIPGGAFAAAAWSPSGEFLAIAHAFTPFMTVYQRSGVDPARIVARYTTSTAQSINASTPTIVNFTALSFDNASSVTTGASWSFQAKRADGHTVSAFVSLQNAAWVAGNVATLDVYINGFWVAQLDKKTVQANSTERLTLGNTDWFWLNPGDLLNVQLSHTRSAAVALETSDISNHISIVADSTTSPLPVLTKVSNPVTLPASDAKAVAWSPDNQLLAVGHLVTPFLSIYQRTGTTLAKLTNPSTLPSDSVSCASWSPDGQYLAIGVVSTPFLQIYKRSGTTFTLVTPPAVLPAGACMGVTWYPTGQFLAVAMVASPYIAIYAFDGTTLTKQADPSLLPPAQATSVSWSANGEFLAVGHYSSPYLSTYQSGSTVPDEAVFYAKGVNLG